MLQQYLPLAVLKRIIRPTIRRLSSLLVATVLTACGIETDIMILILAGCLVATVFTVYGIETYATPKSLRL